MSDGDWCKDDVGMGDEGWCKGDVGMGDGDWSKDDVGMGDEGWCKGGVGMSDGDWCKGGVGMGDRGWMLAAKAERAIDLVAATLTGWLTVDHLRAEKGRENAIYLLVNVAYKEWNIFVMI
ncbi:hypothetical protein Pcinc_043826 [Petrolisthes cinctipes]|uniref:Uncharacterized protein n=1 Tax=Petrolisthes cinctipes TaxID=88211 RepID=A0AAE1BFW6_PETCI|nr:hypothetical protein Pcinc_043826 [Petrolisthes cinctipes]